MKGGELAGAPGMWMTDDTFVITGQVNKFDVQGVWFCRKDHLQ